MFVFWIFLVVGAVFFLMGVGFSLRFLSYMIRGVIRPREIILFPILGAVLIIFGYWLITLCWAALQG